MTRRNARKKMVTAVGRLKTPREHHEKEAKYYGYGLYYSVEDICRALGVSIDQFFSTNLRKEILVFNSGIKLKV